MMFLEQVVFVVVGLEVLGILVLKVDDDQQASCSLLVDVDNQLQWPVGRHLTHIG